MMQVLEPAPSSLSFRISYYISMGCWNVLYFYTIKNFITFLKLESKYNIPIWTDNLGCRTVRGTSDASPLATMATEPWLDLSISYCFKNQLKEKSHIYKTQSSQVTSTLVARSVCPFASVVCPRSCMEALYSCWPNSEFNFWIHFYNKKKSCWFLLLSWKLSSYNTNS